MVQYTLEAEDSLDCERAVALLHRLARQTLDELGFHHVELLGPAPATIYRLKNKYRWNLGAFSKSPKRLNSLTRRLRDTFPAQAPRAVSLKADLDPYGLF